MQVFMGRTSDVLLVHPQSFVLLPQHALIPDVPEQEVAKQLQLRLMKEDMH